MTQTMFPHEQRIATVRGCDADAIVQGLKKYILGLGQGFYVAQHINHITMPTLLLEGYHGEAQVSLVGDTTHNVVQIIVSGARRGDFCDVIANHLGGVQWTSEVVS